jgi:hypothetical protein
MAAGPELATAAPFIGIIVLTALYRIYKKYIKGYLWKRSRQDILPSTTQDVATQDETTTQLPENAPVNIVQENTFVATQTPVHDPSVTIHVDNNSQRPSEAYV